MNNLTYFQLAENKANKYLKDNLKNLDDVEIIMFSLLSIAESLNKLTEHLLLKEDEE